MRQFTYETIDCSKLAEQLQEVRAYIDSTSTASVLAHIYTGYTERARVENASSAIQAVLPEAKIVGSTAGGEIREGTLAPRSIVVAVSVFETTSIAVSTYSVLPGEETRLGEAVLETIEGTAGIKAAELLVDCRGISTDIMFPIINRCSSRIKIFGAVPYAHDLKQPMYIFTGGAAEEVTLILITYAGEEFAISTDYVIGWQPMGAAMRISKANFSVLNELDGQPAFTVYDKYLQIPQDEHFYENAFVFPFLRYTNDTYMMRLPYAALSDGSIELRAPVQEGDIMYLSYGDVPTILNEIFEARGRLERFYPQCIRLHNCATRQTFWGSEIARETEPFQRLATTNGFLTGGEILRVNGELVHFNATLVVVGMREGSPSSSELLRMRDIVEQNEVDVQQTFMVRRMAHFINVAMQELKEANTRIEELS